MREEIFWGGTGGGRHACGFLFNFSTVTENAIITIKLLIFFHIFSNLVPRYLVDKAEGEIWPIRFALRDHLSGM